jgi:hypothetical protein|tara:strand:+ start:25 stop:615 length:591 start_codon:yes stop_codon:yes gene_type:complete
MPFWTTSHSDTATINDPKRKFRFIVTLGNISEDGGQAWYAKTATKPSFTIATTEHKYLNHTFYYPGSVTWNDVEITLVDPVSPIDVSATLSDIVQTAGYNVPSTALELQTMSKAKASTALGVVTVAQLNSDGEPLESWVLNNAFITDVKYGDLEYGSDDITELSMTLKYDWATCKVENSGGSKMDESTSAGEFFKS